MSKLFFDHLLNLEDVEVEIKKAFQSKEEREESESLIDGFVNSKVLDKIFDKLPEDFHPEFLELYHKCPHDEVVIFAFLREKTGEDMESYLKRELEAIGTEILKEIGLLHEVRKEIDEGKISKK